MPKSTASGNASPPLSATGTFGHARGPGGGQQDTPGSTLFIGLMASGAEGQPLSPITRSAVQLTRVCRAITGRVAPDGHLRIIRLGIGTGYCAVMVKPSQRCNAQESRSKYRVRLPDGAPGRKEMP
jgi:nicotinamide mononucleotide (NMN) deamidase PncC